MSSAGHDELAGGRLEKLMSLSEAEYLNGVEVLGGSDARAIARRGLPVPFEAGAGQAAVSFERLPDSEFGGLLKLPQARVTISFRDVAPDERAAFLRRFDIAFQRGGG